MSTAFFAPPPRTPAPRSLALWLAAVALLGILAPARAEEAPASPTAETAIEAATSSGTPAAVKRSNKKECQPHIGCVTNLPIPRFVTLKGDEGNARRGPSLTQRIDWVFTRPGMPLRVTAEYENWRRVEDQDGAGGWVHYALLSGVRSALITTDMAELRDAAQPEARVLAQAEIGVVARIMSCTQNWCRLNLGGTKGWLPKTDIWGVTADEIID